MDDCSSIAKWRSSASAEQLGDAVLVAQARQHNPDLLLGRILLARPASKCPPNANSGSYGILEMTDQVPQPKAP